MADDSSGQRLDDSSGLKLEDLKQRIQASEQLVIHEFFGSQAVVDDCLDLITKARGSINDNKLIEANSTVLRLEARIKTAQNSRKVLRHKCKWLQISFYNLIMFGFAMWIGWVGICGLYNSFIASDNKTQPVVVASSGQVIMQSATAPASPFSLVSWLVLGFAAGILGGVVIGIFGLVFHGVQGDFSEDYLSWYCLKPFKGGLAGMVAVLPFLAGLAVFQTYTQAQMGTAIAYVIMASFLVGYCERYFLQLIDRVATMIFKPADSAGSGNNTVPKP